MTEITSATNSQFKFFLSLLESKGLKKERHFLLSGKNLTQEFLQDLDQNQTSPIKLKSEIVCEGLSPLTLKHLNHRDHRIFKLSQTLFHQIDVLGTHAPILVLQQPEIPDWNPNLSLPGLAVASPLGDPSNLGALIRSAEAFGIENFILLQESAHPFLPKSVKASAGSVLRMKFHRGTRLQDFLHDKTLPLIGLHLRGIRLDQFRWPSQGILVLGEEGPGLPASPHLTTVQIPTEKVESLNATVAASIALYDYHSKSKKS